MVNMRLALVGKRTQLTFPTLGEGGAAKPRQTRDVYFTDPANPVACPIYQRTDLGFEGRIAGPALIQEHGTTTVLFAGDSLVMAASGEMIIALGGA